LVGNGRDVRQGVSVVSGVMNVMGGGSFQGQIGFVMQRRGGVERCSEESGCCQ